MTDPRDARIAVLEEALRRISRTCFESFSDGETYTPGSLRDVMRQIWKDLGAALSTPTPVKGEKEET